MRFLCLHGQGTSAAIFRVQTAAFRSKLDNSFQFDFVDSPYPYAPAAGIDVLFPDSEYFSFWPQPSVEAIRESHVWLENQIAKNGPYDAVCCFSQGCSVIGSYLLYHAKERPEARLPFKAAIFICGGMPFATLEDLGLPISDRARELNQQTHVMLKQKTSALSDLAADLDKIQPGVGLWDQTGDLIHNASMHPDPSDVFGLDYTAFPEHIRIKIPTVNIYGRKDPRYPASMQLAYFCENRAMYDHGGGHDVPRAAQVSLRIAQLVRNLAAEVKATSR